MDLQLKQALLKDSSTSDISTSSVAGGEADDDGVEETAETAAKSGWTELLEPASSVGAGDDEDGVTGAEPETDDDECEREAERIAKWFTSQT